MLFWSSERSSELPAPLATSRSTTRSADAPPGEPALSQSARAFIDAVRSELRFPNAAPVERIDLKFIEGTPEVIHRNPDAWQERWRFYWNGEHWVRKPPGASLHDWNKWGRRLEHIGAVNPGGFPPQDGWPPVLDLPPGRYKLRVLELRWKSGRRGEPELEWCFRVLAGPYLGRRIYYRAAARTPAQRLRLMQDLTLFGVTISQEALAHPPFPLEPVLVSLAKVAVQARVCLQSGYLRLYLNRVLERQRSAPGSSSTAAPERARPSVRPHEDPHASEEETEHGKP